MLQAMQQPASTSAPSPNASSFAGLLAALAAPAPKSNSAWNDDDLADDVATLSYEHALRNHARYRSESPSDRSLPESPRQSSGLMAETDPLPGPAPIPPRSPSVASLGSPPVSRPASLPGPRAASETGSLALGRELKRTSITIRISEAEGAQLRQRAFEAGLTVSAYLRSCTFEAESLRAMVRDTLAQLRSVPAPQQHAAADLPRRPGFRNSWRRKLAAWLTRS